MPRPPGRAEGRAGQPIPAPEETAALWKQFTDARDPELRRRLVESYLPFVRILAAKLYAGRHIAETEFDEFLHYGVVGLIECIDRYEPGRNVDFKAYAAHRIQGSILNGIEKVSEKQQQIALRSRLKKERLAALATDRGGKQAGKGDLFGELVEIATGLAIGYMLDGSGMYQPEEADPAEDNAYRRQEVEDLQRVLTVIVDALPEQEKAVIRYHYFQRMGVEEIGDLMGVTKGRISQIHRSGLRLLREAYLQATQLNLRL